MKKLALLALTLGVTMSSFAQGYFVFDNSAAFTGDNTSSVLSFVGPTGGSGQGTIGTILGSGSAPWYSVSFLWALGLPGSFANQAAFESAAFQGTVTTDYIATSGDIASGAGIFTGGNAVLPGRVDGEHITVEVISWFNPGGNTQSYQAAVAAGTINVGHSSMMDIRLAAGADPVIADMSGMTGFSVGVLAVPEPSTFALAGLGTAALLIFRRRK